MRAWLLGAVFAAGPEFGITVAPSQESLTLLQQVVFATYVAAGTGLLAMWAFGRDEPRYARHPSPEVPGGLQHDLCPDYNGHQA